MVKGTGARSDPREDIKVTAALPTGTAVAAEEAEAPKGGEGEAFGLGALYFPISLARYVAADWFSVSLRSSEAPWAPSQLSAAVHDPSICHSMQSMVLYRMFSSRIATARLASASRRRFSWFRRRRLDLLLGCGPPLTELPSMKGPELQPETSLEAPPLDSLWDEPRPSPELDKGERDSMARGPSPSTG